MKNSIENGSVDGSVIDEILVCDCAPRRKDRVALLQGSSFLL